MHDATLAPQAPPQHIIALARANTIRGARARLRAELKAGARLASDVVLEPPEEAETMELFDLLTTLRRFGRRRALAVLAVVCCSEQKRLGTLTPRQRAVLADELRRLGQ